MMTEQRSRKKEGGLLHDGLVGCAGAEMWSVQREHIYFYGEEPSMLPRNKVFLKEELSFSPFVEFCFSVLTIVGCCFIPVRCTDLPDSGFGG